MQRLKKQLCGALEAMLKGERPEVPEAGGELLDAFLSLSRARGYHTHGPNPITWEALAAWMQVMRVPLEPAHCEIVMALDAIWMEDAVRRVDGAPEGMNTLPPRSSQPLTAGLLDLAFR